LEKLALREVAEKVGILAIRFGLARLQKPDEKGQIT